MTKTPFKINLQAGYDSHARTINNLLVAPPKGEGK
jgi:hypothetical protein